MNSKRPEIIAINHDDYHAEHIGTTPDGNQFFLTTPFEPAMGEDKGCEYIALFVFSPAGDLLTSNIETLGPREELKVEEARSLYNAKLDKLGEVSFERIEVKPFSVNYNGVEIGLIVREPEEEGDVWAVELLPGNYMAFFEPWGSGDYDT